MVPSRTVTLLAADIPLRDRLRLDVVVDRMAAVTERSSWARRVCLRVECGPPIRTASDVIRPPDLMAYVQLSAQRKIVVADLLKVSLLPLGPVDKCDVLFLERKQGVRASSDREG